MKDKKKLVEEAKSKKIEDANIESNNDLRNKIIDVKLLDYKNEEFYGEILMK